MKINKKFVIVAAIAAAVSFLAAFTQTASAATTTVTVGPGFTDTFSPANVTINVNDSVVWTWASTDHSSTSGTNGNPGDDNGVPSGSWDSGVIFSTPHTFTNTFTSAGVFQYYCTIHFSFGMLGKVTVVGASLPPSLAITSPPNGAVFAAPANVNIQAGVTNGTASVTNVQFLANSTLLASENSGPFSTTANSLTAGSYALSAIAKDSGGLSATNTVNISVVTPVAVTLTNPVLSGTTFQFTYGANVGLDYVIERANSLVPPNWVPIATNVAASNPTNFVDTHATNNPAFYRVGRLPNP